MKVRLIFESSSQTSPDTWTPRFVTVDIAAPELSHRKLRDGHIDGLGAVRGVELIATEPTEQP